MEIMLYLCGVNLEIMKLKEAMALIKSAEKKKPVKKEIKGFMVGFEKREDGMLCSGNFPDKYAGEKLIKTEEEAWELAKRFAKATDENEYINICVKDSHFRPVAGYYEKTIRRYNP
jgi:hypothetical protein